METREEIVEQLTSIKNKEKELRQKLDSIDYESKLTEVEKNVGKYFLQLTGSDGYFRCAYVYGIDKTDCSPLVLDVYYWKDQEKGWFAIEFNSTFSIKSYDDSEDSWEEIEKEVFLEHYKEVQRRISLAFKS